MTIALPTEPDGEQYEDLVVAGLQALGYFVETQLKLREGKKEVLELDVVATPSGGAPEDRILFEVKKERFSFTNIFKLFGQRTYLRIPRAGLVSLHGGDPDHLPVYVSKGDELGVGVCHLQADIMALQRLAPAQNALGEAEHAAITAAAWYQQIARRIALADLLMECRSRRGTAALDHARTYLFNMRASFFQPEPLVRAEALYSAYLATPKLSAEAVALVMAERKLKEKVVWTKVRDSHELLWIQAIVDTEANGRLSIVKNGLDDFLLRGALPAPTTTLKVGNLTLKVPLHALPESFHRGLEALREHSHSRRLPYLFQAFYTLLGGFLFFQDEQELAMMESLTGIPAAELVNTLRLLDHFFAPADSTFFFTAKNNLLCLKMVPGFVRGGGAFLRRMLFKIENYEDRYPIMGWLIARWHNALYHSLEPYLKKS